MAWGYRVFKQQDITWANVDPDLLGHNELNNWGLVTPFGHIDLGQHWLR